MADFTTGSKDGLGALLPAGAVDTSWSRVEPLLTAKQLKGRFLFGIKLKSPETGQVMTDDMLDDFIAGAVTEAETETKLNLGSTQIDERIEYDRQLYLCQGYTRLRQRPVSSVQSMEVVASNDITIYSISLDWIDRGFLHLGLIYVLPVNLALSNTSSGLAPTGGAGGAPLFLALLGQSAYVPAYWKIRYTTGFPENQWPRSVNDLVGSIAAINVLVELAGANARQGSKSLGMDGLSQSSSNPGDKIYSTKIEALEKRRVMLVGRIRTHFGTKWAIGEL